MSAIEKRFRGMAHRTLHVSYGISWAGLATGPVAWWLFMHINHALLNWACEVSWSPTPVLAAVFSLISLAGAFGSWRAWGRYIGPGIRVREQGGHPGYLMSGLGVATGLLFAAVIVIQGIVVASVDPCFR